MHSDVKKEDYEAFAKMNGLCTIGFGFSIIFTGIGLVIEKFTVGTLLFSICFLASFSVYLVAQKKYNK